MEYLKNDICKFTPLCNINYNIKKDIISMVLFKMYNSGYKDFSFYTKGLTKVYNHYKNKYGNKYTLRLFIDDTIYNDEKLMNDINKLTKLEVIRYSCPSYKIVDNYHIELFGTLVRFFPMFDFPNNDANHVFIDDVDDFNPLHDNLINYINLMKKNNILNKIYLLKANHKKILNKKHDVLTYNNKLNIIPVAGNIVSLKRIDKQIIISYLNEVLNSKNKIYSQYIDSTLQNNNKNLSKFIYGVDEYFLNVVLSQYIIDNNIGYATYINYRDYVPLYINMIKYYDKKNNKLLNYIFEYIFDKCEINYNKKDSVENKYKKLDNILWNSEKNKNYNSFIYKIHYHIYKLFIYLLNSKKYNFLFEHYIFKFMLDNFFGLYDFKGLILYYDNDIHKITIEENKFNDSDINKLKEFYNKYNN